MMNVVKKALVVGACCATVLALGSSSAMAQGRGNNGGGGGGGFNGGGPGGGGGGGRRGGGPQMDPAQMRADFLSGMKDTLEVTDDSEWNALSPKVGAVYDGRIAALADAGRNMMRGGRRGNPGGGQPGAQPGAAPGGNRRGGGMFGQQSVAMTALQKAVDDKAPSAEIKTKLKAVQDEASNAQAKLKAAQEELRGLLTPRQEAIATLNGLF